ncbi:unnamed protein product [Lactuca saligna]|uniref:Eukaryotic translation initiation factor 4C n=1 Tax=Lactuca saligna TaxID=75948 RepID=A0AA35ZHJ9_LACSI|nr:unnamed protein product [Lactuca saligna]
MPKNKGKGGKNRKRGKNEADDEKRELVFKEDGQEYAQVLRMLGNGRCESMCIDGTKRLSHIRGKMHKKVWIAAGDIILVGLRDYQDDKADVILKYMPDEARMALVMIISSLKTKTSTKSRFSNCDGMNKIESEGSWEKLMSSMDPTPPPSPDTINSDNSISSTDRLNLNDLHTIFYDCCEKIAEQKGQVERMKEEMGRDYLHSRVDVLNM